MRCKRKSLIPRVSNHYLELLIMIREKMLKRYDQSDVKNKRNNNLYIMAFHSLLCSYIYIYMHVSSLGKLMVRQLNRPFISNRSTKAICMKVKITLLFDNSKSEF